MFSVNPIQSTRKNTRSIQQAKTKVSFRPTGRKVLGVLLHHVAIWRESERWWEERKNVSFLSISLSLCCSVVPALVPKSMSHTWVAREKNFKKSFCVSLIMISLSFVAITPIFEYFSLFKAIMFTILARSLTGFRYQTFHIHFHHAVPQIKWSEVHIFSFFSH